ncbi:MAG: hypothetical protein OXS47_04280 [Chloroflexota bacterium]|nr:hypothetical protein [Chloroflexota bacterium]
MQKALEHDEPSQKCIGRAADQEAVEAATLAGLTRALCVPCLRRP